MRTSTLLCLVFSALSMPSALAADLGGNTLLMCDREHTPSPSVSPSQAAPEIAPALGRGEFGTVFDKLATRFESTLSPTDQALPEVRAFVARLRKPGRSDPADFQVNPALEPGKETLFETGADAITFDCASLNQRQVDMATTALMAARVLSQRDVEAYRQRARAVAIADKRHTDLLTNGLAMWPWENWLNGKRLGDSDADPLFTTQIIFMRPSIGVEVNTRSRQAANLEGSLIVEPIGFVKYISDDYSKWWGLSLIFTSTTRQGASYGVLGRYGNYSLGLTRHASKVEGSTDDTFLLFSVDLYNMLQTKRAEIPEARAKIKKLSDALFSK